MKRYTERPNPFTPYSRHSASAPMGHEKSPRSLRDRLRTMTDLLHDYPFISVVILALGLCATWYGLSRHQTQTATTAPTASSSSSSSSSSTPVLEKGMPDYPTVVPKGRTAATVNWTRVSPPDHNPVYTYVDTVDKTSLTVSEQPIPDEFASDPDSSIKKLATSYNANQELTVGTITVYIGTSTKGPQSIIFIKNNVLVLIKTDIALSTDQWMAYISNLQ